MYLTGSNLQPHGSVILNIHLSHKHTFNPFYVGKKKEKQVKFHKYNYIVVYLLFTICVSVTQNKEHPFCNDKITILFYLFTQYIHTSKQSFYYKQI